MFLFLHFCLLITGFIVPLMISSFLEVYWTEVLRKNTFFADGHTI